MLQRRRFNESNSLRQWHFGNQQHLVTWYHLVQNYQILAFSSVVTEITGLHSSSISWKLINVVKQHSMSSCLAAPPRIPSGQGSFFGTSSMYVSRCSATKKPFSCKKSTWFRWQHSNCDTPSSGENDLDMTLGNLRWGATATIKKSSFLDLRPYPFQRLNPRRPRWQNAVLRHQVFTKDHAAADGRMHRRDDSLDPPQGGKKLPLTEHPERWNACFLDELVRMGMRELTKIMGGGLRRLFLQRRTCVFHCSLKELV